MPSGGGKEAEEEEERAALSGISSFLFLFCLGFVAEMAGAETGAKEKVGGGEAVLLSAGTREAHCSMVSKCVRTTALSTLSAFLAPP